MSITKLANSYEFPQKNGIFQIAPKCSLDTLEITSEFSPDELHFNKNSDNSKQNLTKRARSKFLNSALSRKLADLNSPLKDKYWDTFYCSHIIEIVDNKSISKFCKNRWCIICNRIRTADLLHKYLPTLESWEEKVFLTLTIPNCAKLELVDTLNKMLKSFSKIKDNLRKEGNNLIGIRKLEITYNRLANNFHPHYHFILQNGINAEKIIKTWLRLFPEADRKAQDFRPADQSSCFELFKYFTKLTSNSSKDKVITTEALDHIFLSLQGVRTFQPFGFVAHSCETPPTNLNQEIEEFTSSAYFKYQKDLGNWLDENSGEVLADFTPTERDQNFQKFIH